MMIDDDGEFGALPRGPSPWISFLTHEDPPHRAGAGEFETGFLYNWVTISGGTP